MKYLLTALLFFAVKYSYSQNQLYNASGGTSIVALITDDSIWIAADSKQSLRTRTGFVSSYHLKINNIDSIFFTVAGSVCNLTNENNITFFDAVDIIKYIINQHKGFDSTFHNTMDEIANALNRVYIFMPDTLKSEFQSTAGGHLLEVGIFGNNKELKHKGFAVGLMKIGDNFKFISEELNLKKTTPALFCTGFYDNILKVFSEPLFIMDMTKVKETLIRVVGLEAKDHPDYVGGTTDVIVIYKNGYKWLTDNKY